MQVTVSPSAAWYMHHKVPYLTDAFYVHAPAACSSTATWDWIC